MANSRCNWKSANLSFERDTGACVYSRCTVPRDRFATRPALRGCRSSATSLYRRIAPSHPPGRALWLNVETGLHHARWLISVVDAPGCAGNLRRALIAESLLRGGVHHRRAGRCAADDNPMRFENTFRLAPYGRSTWKPSLRLASFQWTAGSMVSDRLHRTIAHDERKIPSDLALPKFSIFPGAIRSAIAVAVIFILKRLPNGAVGKRRCACRRHPCPANGVIIMPLSTLLSSPQFRWADGKAEGS